MAGGDTEADVWRSPGWAGTGGFIKVSATSGSTTTGGSSSRIWKVWSTQSNATSTTGVVFDDVWASWNDLTSSVTTNYTGEWQRWVISNDEYRERRKETEAARRRREREWRAEQTRKRKEREAATSRARKILVEHLDQDQRRTLDQHGYFDIKIEVAGAERVFRIFNNKYQHNVFELDESGNKVREFCAHTSHACPQSDHALAQKLLLEADPQQFFRVANIWNLRGGRQIISNSGADFMPPQPQLVVARA
jgi:hypothetical protein